MGHKVNNKEKPENGILVLILIILGTYTWC